MPKVSYSQSMLSGLVDSDSDDQLVNPSEMPTPDSAAENKAPAKRGRAKAKAAAPAKVTRAKAPVRRASSRPEAKAKPTAAPKGGRKALADTTIQLGETDTEDVDDLGQNEDVEMEDVGDASVIAIKETKTKVARRGLAGRSKATQEAPANTSNSVENAADASALNVRAKKENIPPRRLAQSMPSPERVIMETQLSVIEVDEDVTQTASRTTQSAARRRSLSRARQPSVQHRRAGSASDTERSDPALRRKLGEITKKYDNLNVKYQDLREIGLKEAERNFDRLRKQNEEKSSGKSNPYPENIHD
jgi:hypothetical protein